ncbi:MAG: rod shape-determining protein [bacterium]
MNLFGKDAAVSLVDDSFIFCTQTQACPLVLPAYVAIQTGTNRILACGQEAKAMLGREPNNISVVRVLVEGVVADQQVAEALFRFGLRKLLGGTMLVRPRVLIAFRTYDPGKWSVQNMATMGGAREVYLIEMGMATAIGMQLDVQKPELKAVLSISDDWFEFSVISLAGVLSGANGAIGARAFVEDIQNHFTLIRQFRPEFAALDSQLQSGGVNPRAVVDLPGWETWSGRTEQGRLTVQNASRDEITVGMMPSLVRLTERLKAAIRSLPNEKQSQFSRATIHATGAAAQIPGLTQLIAQQLGHSVTPFSADVHPSIEGCRAMLKELNILKRVNPTGQ